ncbi:uncharacterized protein A4U43_UnF3630 [Asparagus officinalis]|uniref:Uncharacterized protein n=1 Tax=Asparagus officinalis TaxID=4686 RepID=A0A1R3L741_ASPOF|nr:uncharacterized protein A4U43_UnF3630 [Asparagus officinalis]
MNWSILKTVGALAALRNRALQGFFRKKHSDFSSRDPKSLRDPDSLSPPKFLNPSENSSIPLPKILQSLSPLPMIRAPNPNYDSSPKPQPQILRHDNSFDHETVVKPPSGVRPPSTAVRSPHRPYPLPSSLQIFPFLRFEPQILRHHSRRHHSREPSNNPRLFFLIGLVAITLVVELLISPSLSSLSY